MSEWIEQFWAEILSRDPDRTRAAYQGLEDAEEQAALVAHLKRMTTEEGWAEPQRVSAERALSALQSLL